MENKKKTCITIGFFDSFHIGHAHVIDMLLEKSLHHKLEPKVVTLFDESSLVYTSEDEKKYLIEKKGVQNIESIQYSDIFNLKEWIQEEKASILVIGKNFELAGYNSADVKKITDELKIQLVLCDVYCHNGVPLSMGLIKNACKKNNLEAYAELCGHPYTMIGTIVKGKQIGRTVGMPTANLSFSKSKILPEQGVYSTVSHFGNEKFMGMTNIGLRPTVDDEKKITVETFIIDFDRMVYGETCVLEVHFFTRGVKKFNSLQEVQQQVAQDIEVSRSRLASIYSKF